MSLMSEYENAGMSWIEEWVGWNNEKSGAKELNEESEGNECMNEWTMNGCMNAWMHDEWNLQKE